MFLNNQKNMHQKIKGVQTCTNQLHTKNKSKNVYLGFSKMTAPFSPISSCSGLILTPSSSNCAGFSTLNFSATGSLIKPAR